MQNWLVVARSFFTTRHISAIPFLGGLIGLAGLLVWPEPGTPLVIDYGSRPAVLGAIWLGGRSKDKS